MLKPLLVVDDDHEMRVLVQTLLEREGYEVDTACDGQIAWEKLATRPGTYGAVLLDVSMPRMDGLQLIGALLQHDANWRRSIILCSADREALQHGVELGVYHVLKKPFDLEALLALVSTCLAEVDRDPIQTNAATCRSSEGERSQSAHPFYEEQL